jgi:hypothetical protein
MRADSLPTTPLAGTSAQGWFFAHTNQAGHFRFTETMPSAAELAGWGKSSGAAGGAAGGDDYDDDGDGEGRGRSEAPGEGEEEGEEEAAAYKVAAKEGWTGLRWGRPDSRQHPDGGI